MIRVVQFTIAICICLSVFTFQGFSQVIIHEEPFEETLGTWTQYSVTGDRTWIPNSFGDRKYAYINGFDNGPLENEDWLISPALNMNEYEDEVLIFETAQNFTGPNLELYYSSDYDGSSDPSTNGTWVEITDRASWSPGDWEFVSSGNVDLSDVEGDAVYLAFKYISSPDLNAKAWEVDNLRVEATNLSSVKDLDVLRYISSPIMVDGLLQFDILNSQEKLAVFINDMTGRTLIKAGTYQIPGRVEIPLSQLPNGIYTLIIRNANGQFGIKFLK